MTADQGMPFQVNLLADPSGVAGRAVPDRWRRPQVPRSKSSTAADLRGPQRWSWNGIQCLLGGGGFSPTQSRFRHPFPVFRGDRLALFRGELAVLVLVVFLRDFLLQSLLLFGHRVPFPGFGLFVIICSVGCQSQSAAQPKGENQSTQHNL